MIDILVQRRRNARAAKRFFRKLLKGQGREPWRLVTDKLRSYAVAHRSVMPSVVHDTRRYANNRAEVSHQATRQRERLMRRFKSAGQAQRFLWVHGVVQNLFRLARHHLRSANYRLLRLHPRTIKLTIPPAHRSLSSLYRPAEQEAMPLLSASTRYLGRRASKLRHLVTDALRTE